MVCNLCYPGLTVYGEVLPHWVLAYSEKECRDIPAQHYALFNHFHEPCFVWPQEPVESTADKYGDDEADTWEEEDPRSIQESLHIHNAIAMEKHFECDIMTGYTFTKACIDAGYDMQNSGMPLFWLANRMARLIQEKSCTATSNPACSTCATTTPTSSKEEML